MDQQPQSVRVVDFDMSITSLITLFIKMAIASIPAMIIIWFFLAMMSFAAMAIFGVGGAFLGSN